MQLIASILILLGGIACAWFYLGRPPVSPDETSRFATLVADRPWRRVGAAICLLLSIMFVVGLYAVDVPANPKAYAAFWLIIMLLVLWLCVLAVKDVLHTRRLINEWRRARDDGIRGDLGVESDDRSGGPPSDVLKGPHP